MESQSPSTRGSDLNSSPAALESSASSNYSLTTPSGVPSAQALIQHVKVALGALDDTLGELHGQTMQIALLGGEPQITQDVENLRKQLLDNDKRHQEGMQEIKRKDSDAPLSFDELINGRSSSRPGPCASVRGRRALEETRRVVRDEVARKLMVNQVDDDIAREIDQLVADQVALCLKDHIPQELQDEVATQQRILEEIRRDLHNSENRRSNATLRSDHGDDSLQVIYKADGSVPALFPSNLQALFDMDATTSRRLMMEYGMTDCSESRERNLNRLMQFFGVRYQMVREGSATHSVGLA